MYRTKNFFTLGGWRGLFLPFFLHWRLAWMDFTNARKATITRYYLDGSQGDDRCVYSDDTTLLGTEVCLSGERRPDSFWSIVY